MKILLNPKYESLRPWLEGLESRFEAEGQTLRNGRDLIKTLRAPDGRQLCVKRYAQTGLLRRLAGRLLSTSGSRRAYRLPMLLRERGFESPESVALVRAGRGLLGRMTYLVSLNSPYRYRLDRLASCDEAERRAVAEAFARYVARLHDDGFLHRGLTAGNVVYDYLGGRYRFALVDTAPLRHVHAVSLERGCRDLAGLGADDAFLALLGHAYARARGADPEHVRALMAEGLRRNAAGQEPPQE